MNGKIVIFEEIKLLYNEKMKEISKIEGKYGKYEEEYINAIKNKDIKTEAKFISFYR